MRHSLCQSPGCAGRSCRGRTSTEPHPALQQTHHTATALLPAPKATSSPSKKASSPLPLLIRAQSAPGSRVFNHISFVNLLARQQTASDSMRKGIKSICSPFAASVPMLIVTWWDSQGSALPCYRSHCALKSKAKGLNQNRTARCYKKAGE